MPPGEMHRRACLSLLIVLVVLFDGFILAFGQYIDLSVDIRPEPLDILRAQMTLAAAWLVFGTGHSAWRVMWSVIAIAVLWLLAMKYRADDYNIHSLRDTVMLSLISDIASLLPCLVIFIAQRKASGLRIVHKRSSFTLEGPLRFRLRDILLITAACAVIAFLLRNVVDHNYPRFPSTMRQSALLVFGQPTFLTVVGIGSLIPGLFMAPCALIVLKPNRRVWLWAIYFFIICAMEPVIDFWVILGPKTSPIPTHQTISSWLVGYLQFVGDNAWWYGVGLVPTVVVFILLRGAGVRVAESEEQRAESRNAN